MEASNLVDADSNPPRDPAALSSSRLRPPPPLQQSPPDAAPPPPQPPLPEAPKGSAVTRAEKYERDAPPGSVSLPDDIEPSPAKRIKLDSVAVDPEPERLIPDSRVKGVAQVKTEFLIHPPGSKQPPPTVADDDAAEASHRVDDRDHGSSHKSKGKPRGQNKNRSFGSSRDSVELCASRATYPELSPRECRFGDGCKYEHDLRKYLAKGKREALTTFGGRCPVWDAKGACDMGWKCRFLPTHMVERTNDDGVRELVLTQREDGRHDGQAHATSGEGVGVVNVVGTQDKTALMKRKMKTPKSDGYVLWLEKNGREMERQQQQPERSAAPAGPENGTGDDEQGEGSTRDNAAMYTEPPFLPSEKRRVYFGPETPVLAPLTTQGNLPFRRLCLDLGAQLTYSEMAMSMPLVQGNKSEWALMKAHEDETTPPAFRGAGEIVAGYEHSRDLKFGAQISGNKPAQVLKATEVLTALCPHLRVVDLNCGCPIDLVYRAGAGSALLDSQAKLEKMLRGMNAVSGEVPITLKIRMGTKNGKPTALKLVQRLLNGGLEASEYGGGSSGIAAVTLHGRSRQQRYTRSADWGYISECAALVKTLKRERDAMADTVRECDARTLPSAPGGKVYFVGNGDCYSHVDYSSHIENAAVDSVMLARGALIKPWVFEEIEKRQYLDKSATERLAYVEKFARYGLEVWGSDEIGLGTTRRFLLEWLSFAHRYVPLGILEHLPPSIQDRPPAWKGRNELETLLGSENYKDWIKISEMFLGPAHENFRFEPKHKSNSYEIEAEG